MAASTKELIETAVANLQSELPALAKLKLLIRLELRGRGDVQIYGVSVPGPTVVKGEPDMARIEVSLPRSHFNELAEEGTLKHWVEAYEHGHVRVTGDAAVMKLIGNVIQRQLARA